MDLCCVLSFDTCFTRPPALLPIFFGLCIPSFWLFDNAREIITFFFKKKRKEDILLLTTASFLQCTLEQQQKPHTLTKVDFFQTTGFFKPISEAYVLLSLLYRRDLFFPPPAAIHLLYLSKLSS